MQNTIRQANHAMLARLASFTVLLTVGISTSGCMTTRIEETKDASTGINNDESVVVLANSYHTANPAEDDFIECITGSIGKGRNRLHVHPESEFRDALFPWLEPRTAPNGVDDLPELLARPGVTERIKSRDIRYIIWIQGSTERKSGGGSLSCAAGPGGGGCFGLAWWENLSSYEATIWDLDDGVASGKVTTSVNGTSIVPALIIPIPFIARTQAAACKGLAKQLRSFIVQTETSS
jgi:hypothetical protein